MVNNIGIIASTLSRNINGTITVTDPLNMNIISIISGQLIVGTILTDSDGTVGVIISYTTNANNKLVYTVKTVSINTEIDVQSMLEDEY